MITVKGERTSCMNILSERLNISVHNTSLWKITGSVIKFLHQILIFLAMDGENKKFIHIFMYGKMHKFYTVFRILETKAFFIKLINVSGIGPKGALAILASGKPNTIAHAIEEENYKFLTTFPGVGKKTAQQIILDLKGKFTGFLHDFPEKSETSKHMKKIMNWKKLYLLLRLSAIRLEKLSDKRWTGK